MKRFRRALTIFFVVAVIAFGVLTWLASSRLICPPRRAIQDYHREILANALEHGMSIRAFSAGETPCLLCEPSTTPGAALKGNKLRSELQALHVKMAPWGTVVATAMLLHGHTGCKEDMLPVAERFCAAGFRCILLDLPGHGKHPEVFASFGKSESTLPGEVLYAASKRFDFAAQPAVLFGVSQGGAIALQAAARADDKWSAVAELSSFESLDLVVSRQARTWFGPLAVPADGMVSWLVHHRAGYRPSEIRPIDAVAKLTLPVLIGHGDADAYVTPDQANHLFDAVHSDTKQFLNVPGAGHHSVFVTEAPVYATIGRFLLEAVRPL